MRPRLVIGNWKMHGSPEFVRQFAGDLGARADHLAGIVGEGVEIVICPTHVHLQAAAEALAGSVVKLGAQDAFHEKTGAYTGEVSAVMLAELGVRYAIVGHSERRQLFGEDNAIVAKKFAAVLEAGLTPILCVGETLQQREQGKTEEVVLAQLNAILEMVGSEGLRGAVLAYEPVWAIGTGQTATPEQAQQIHALLRSHVASQDQSTAAELPILYGGSVKADNAVELFNQMDIDGGLVGGASLKSDQFIAICKLAD